MALHYLLFIIIPSPMYQMVREGNLKRKTYMERLKTFPVPFEVRKDKKNGFVITMTSHRRKFNMDFSFNLGSGGIHGICHKIVQIHSRILRDRKIECCF